MAATGAGGSKTSRTMWEAMLACWTERTGAQMLQDLADGRIPHGAHHELLGLRMRGAEPGRVAMMWEPTREICNFTESGVHGGYIAMVFDDACCGAGASHGDRCYPMLTLNLNIDYFAAIRPGRTYDVHGELVHAGNRRMVACGRIHDPEGVLAARATATVIPDPAFVERAGHGAYGR